MKEIKHEREKWPKYRFVVLFMNLITFMLLTAFMVSFSISAPELKSAFSLTDVRLSYGFTIFMIGWVISLWWGGKAFDKFGMKKTMIAVSLLFLIPQFFIPYIHSWSVILGLRFIQGNVCAMFPGFVALLGQWFPEKEHGLASGIFVGGLGLGTAVGNILCSRLIPLVGWQMTFVVLGIIAVIIITGWFLVASRSPPTLASSHSSPKRKEILESGPTEKGEKKVSIYLMSITWLLAFIMLGNCWQKFAMYGVTQSMLYDYGYSMKQVGTLGLVLGLIGALSCPLGGICSDRLSKKMNTTQARVLTMFIGFVIATAGTLAVPFLSRETFGVALFAMLWMGWGVPWTDGPYWALPTEVFPKGRAGEGGGFAGFIGNFSDIFGPIVAIWLGVNMGWIASMSFLAAGAFLGAVFCLILFYWLKSKERRKYRKG